MAKRYFCSYCGTPLIVLRKALPNKGIIVELVEPHECDERNTENITDAERPTSAIADLKRPQPEPTKPKAFPVPDYGDKRDKKDIKSSAPTGILSQVKSGQNTNPENDLED